MIDAHSIKESLFDACRLYLSHGIAHAQQTLASSSDAQRMDQILTTLDVRPHPGLARLGSLVEPTGDVFYLHQYRSHGGRFLNRKN